jgi:hypothetical protein
MDAALVAIDPDWPLLRRHDDGPSQSGSDDGLALTADRQHLPGDGPAACSFPGERLLCCIAGTRDALSRPPRSMRRRR